MRRQSGAINNKSCTQQSATQHSYYWWQVAGPSCWVVKRQPSVHTQMSIMGSATSPACRALNPILAKNYQPSSRREPRSAAASRTTPLHSANPKIHHAATTAMATVAADLRHPHRIRPADRLSRCAERGKAESKDEEPAVIASRTSCLNHCRRHTSDSAQITYCCGSSRHHRRRAAEAATMSPVISNGRPSDLQPKHKDARANIDSHDRRRRWSQASD